MNVTWRHTIFKPTTRGGGDTAACQYCANRPKVINSNLIRLLLCTPTNRTRKGGMKESAFVLGMALKSKDEGGIIWRPRIRGQHYPRGWIEFILFVYRLWPIGLLFMGKSLSKAQSLLLLLYLSTHVFREDSVVTTIRPVNPESALIYSILLLSAL